MAREQARRYRKIRTNRMQIFGTDLGGPAVVRVLASNPRNVITGWI
jgi:hypothetical protein